jgi:hypothetical protein
MIRIGIREAIMAGDNGKKAEIFQLFYSQKSIKECWLFLKRERI